MPRPINNIRTKEDKNKPRSEVYLILDNIRSILNIGAIFRTAEATGVKKIFLCGISAYPSNKDIKFFDKTDIKVPIQIDPSGKIEIKYTPSRLCYRKSLEKRIAKTALKALGNIEFEYQASIASLIDKLKKENVNIVALEQDRRSIDYRQHHYSKPLAIIIGNEISGIDTRILSLTDSIVEIPMLGIGKSLNLATATGIILYKAIEKDIDLIRNKD